MGFDKILREVYYDKSGRFKGVSRLWNEVRGRDGFFGIKFREVKAFVEKTRELPRNKTVSCSRSEGEKR